MHVGLVIRRLVGRNGEEQGTAELAGELARRGLRVTVLSAGEAQPPADGGFEAVDLGIGRLEDDRAYQAFDAAVRRERAARGIDLIHSMGPTIACDLYQPRGGTVAETYARYAAMPRGPLDRLRVKLRLRFSPSMRAKLRREREFFARRPMPVMIAMSHYVARQLWHHYGVPPEQVHTVFGAVGFDPPAAAEKDAWRREIRDQLAAPADATLLLFVAQQFSQKGLGYLIDALAMAEGGLPTGAGGFALAVIGRDDKGPYLRRAARRALSAPIHFLGELGRGEVRRFYAAADALVLPTVFDACSRTVLESLAMGTPAITTEHNGAGELVDKHEAGAVVHSAWAVAELATALVGAANSDLRRQWAAAAAGLAGYVSVGRMAEELMAIYRGMA